VKVVCRAAARSRRSGQASRPPADVDRVAQAEASTVSSTRFGEDVERLLEEGRSAPPLRPSARRLAAELLIGGGFVAAAVAMPLALHPQRPFSAGLAAALVLAYALASRVQFDVGPGYTAPTQLFFFPMLFALPPVYAPLLVACGLILADLPEYLLRRRHPLRAIHVLGDSWHALGPALVLAAAGEPDPSWSDWPLYVAALGAQFAADLGASIAREWLGRGVRPAVQLGVLRWVYAVDTLLTPVGVLAALAAPQTEYAFLLLLPLPALMVVFAHERRARIDSALRLRDAYRERSELSEQVLATERAARRSREELIAAASHELQTPLAVLVGLMEALEDGSSLPHQQRREGWARMRRQAVLLRHLVQQFVDYTRLKAGRELALDPRPTDVGPVAQSVAEAWRGQGEIDLDLPEDLPMALIDADRLHQALMNIVSNAVKFSPPGARTTITGRATELAVEISVTDEGPGIAPAQLPGLFSELTVTGAAAEAPGAGLGLFMARTLLERQGGTIDVASSPGKGSRFTLVLPRAQPVSPAAAAARAGATAVAR
jgi:signal transduction histidine kinase